MFNQPSVTCEAALLGALRNRRLVGSLLTQKKTVQFSPTSLSYRPIAALSTGVDCDPRPIRVFAQIRAELFAFLGLWPSAIKRSRVQIFDLATTLTYEGEPTAVVVALYRRLEQLGYEANRCLWWRPSTGDLNNYSTLFLFFSLHQDFDCFQK